jgi:hypothetical protein
MKHAAAFALVCLFASNAEAATTTYKIKDVCRFDMEQYCKGIKAKRLRDLKACLAKNERNLLPRCQDHYKEAN